MKRVLLSWPLLTASVLMAPAASACVMDPMVPPPPTWWSIKSPSPTPGFVRQQLYMTVGIFPPIVPTSCVCGFGYGGAAIPDLLPLGASVVIWNPRTEMVEGTVPEFDSLALNANTTAGFNDPLQYPAGADFNWFGFGGLIPAFTPPPPPSGSVFAICIVMDVPVVWDELFKAQIGCVAGGVGDANFNPIFQNDPHAVGNPFGCVVIGPSPGSADLLAKGVICAAKRRRRS